MAERTYVFIDESGDSGFKLGRGSTPVLCLAAVIFRSAADIDTTEAAIEAVKPALGLRKTHEFHFTHETARIRRAFCEAVAACPFSVRAVVVDKGEVLEGTGLRRNPSHFYNFVAKMLLQHSLSDVARATVCIDGRMNHDLATYVRQHLNKENRVVEHVKFRDSKALATLQLADMVAGAIARSYRADKTDAHIYRRCLRDRIDRVWAIGGERGK
jgi:hypothetical protein